jgi:D-alanine--poly(phosphoribitol) ligase subunit 1
MLELDALVVDAKGAGLLTPAVMEAAPRQIIIADGARDIEAQSGKDVVRLGDIGSRPMREPAQVGAGDTAYIIFTSGTTGMPKGVMISAGSLASYLEQTRPWTQLTCDDRLAETCDVTFDLTVHNLFLCVEAGASLHVLSALEMLAPGRFVRARNLTVWMSVPTLVAMMRRNRSLKPGVFPACAFPSSAANRCRSRPRRPGRKRRPTVSSRTSTDPPKARLSACASASPTPPSPRPAAASSPSACHMKTWI